MNTIQQLIPSMENSFTEMPQTSRSTFTITGKITKYVIDKNTYFDSNNDGVKDNDELTCESKSVDHRLPESL